MGEDRRRFEAIRDQKPSYSIYQTYVCIHIYTSYGRLTDALPHSLDFPPPGTAQDRIPPSLGYKRAESDRSLEGAPPSIAYTAAAFDVRDAHRQRVLYQDVYLTLFLAFLLLLSAHAFARDARRLIVEPIEWIVGMVRKLAEDPLGVIEVCPSERSFIALRTTAPPSDPIRSSPGCLSLSSGPCGPDTRLPTEGNEGEEDSQKPTLLTCPPSLPPFLPPSLPPSFP